VFSDLRLELFQKKLRQSFRVGASVAATREFSFNKNVSQDCPSANYHSDFPKSPINAIELTHKLRVDPPFLSDVPAAPRALFVPQKTTFAC
jgi:hypothetical protein